MKKYLLTSLTIFSIFFLSSCSQFESDMAQTEIQMVDNPHRVSAERAKEAALAFVDGYSLKTRSAETNIPETTIDVTAFRWNNKTTRADGLQVNITDTLFYIVNLGQENGFVLVSADDRRTPILAYIEEGSYYGEPNDNPGFNLILDNLIAQCLSEPKDSVIFPPTTRVAADVTQIMYPLLKTLWHQHSPFNKYCPNGYPTGYVPTAFAQICSYLEYPSSFTYNGITTTLNWSQINSYCISHQGSVLGDSLLEDKIAYFLRYLGYIFDAHYESGGTKADADDAVQVMQNLGVDMPSLRSYNSEYIADDLSAGNRIEFMTGFANYYHVGFFFRHYTDGHAWVIDGFLRAHMTNDSDLYLHMNWGWQDPYNGYYWAGLLEPTSTPPYYDDGTARTWVNHLHRDAFLYELRHCCIVKH